MPDDPRRHPSIVRLKRVATSLGPLADRVVFIGGAITPLLQSDPPFGEARPTKDVDAVTASASCGDVGRLHEALRERGFRQDPRKTMPLHRWTSPDGDYLDLVPSGSHPGGSGQEWDQFALQSSVSVDLGDGVTVRHASAPAFLALKWAAYGDRGAADPFASHDLEDIVALVASRATIVQEVAGSPERLRDFIRNGLDTLLADPRLPDLLAGHLNNAQDPAGTARLVLSRLTLAASQRTGSSWLHPHRDHRP